VWDSAAWKSRVPSPELKGLFPWSHSDLWLHHDASYNWNGYDPFLPVNPTTTQVDSTRISRGIAFLIQSGSQSSCTLYTGLYHLSAWQCWFYSQKLISIQSSPSAFMAASWLPCTGRSEQNQVPLGASNCLQLILSSYASVCWPRQELSGFCENHGIIFITMVLKSGLEHREYGHRDPSRWPCDTLHPQKLALTSPTSGCRSVGIGRSRSKVTDLLFLTFTFTRHVFLFFPMHATYDDHLSSLISSFPLKSGRFKMFITTKTA
jgi:hypothetical protein